MDDGILTGPIDLDGRRRSPGQAPPPVPARRGLVITERTTGAKVVVVSFAAGVSLSPMGWARPASCATTPAASPSTASRPPWHPSPPRPRRARPAPPAAWPEVPMGIPWKDGVCAALGKGDPRAFWREVLGSIGDWTDLERPRWSPPSNA